MTNRITIKINNECILKNSRMRIASTERREKEKDKDEKGAIWSPEFASIFYVNYKVFISMDTNGLKSHE